MDLTAVLTPGLRGIDDEAMTVTVTPLSAKCRSITNPHGPVSYTTCNCRGVRCSFRNARVERRKVASDASDVTQFPVAARLRKSDVVPVQIQSDDTMLDSFMARLPSMTSASGTMWWLGAAATAQFTMGRGKATSS